MTLELIVKEMFDATQRVRVIMLTSKDGAPLPPYTAGSHLTFDLGDAGERSYSLIDWPDETELYRIAVQREDDGDGGSKAMHRLSVGDVLTASMPKNDFELTAGSGPFLLLAGGIGVTPVISFATELSRRQASFQFHYTTRSAGVCAFREDVTGAFADNLSIWHDDGSAIDLKALIQAAAPETNIYCCGPKGMIEAVRELAEARRFPKGQVHFELFATPDSHEGDKPFEVEISDGRVFSIPADKTIIEVLEDEGVDVMYDCQRGDCGICQTDVLDGTPDHRDVVLSEAERASGKVMQICVSRAKSARLVLDI